MPKLQKSAAHNLHSVLSVLLMPSKHHKNDIFYPSNDAKPHQNIRDINQ